ncbi:Asparagine synthetase domain-containing protein 1 [Cucurbita argyrosperma subsp. argyrosperma]|uniref:Asparagine synthetase domain-containing protein 1 isoform X1 n=1 Tax=Cucurbita moschata TaxID=3662 RepID=A0A6J1GYL4_CUCMO|nr:asparagine synthetase domain-containing protein 1 isoform X1 [Cucurbita moschata]KAG7032257.1 Asparagine synthetase domain-containing protein 1 [Cucurbita argyrosperma subsp. argyrosperma]
MCGIALVVSGCRLDLSSLHVDARAPSPHPVHEHLEFSIDDLKAALRRRGPDSLGEVKVFISSICSNPGEEQQFECFVERVDCGVAFQNQNDQHEMANGRILQSHASCSSPISGAQFCFLGATLQLRGLNPIVQPLMDASRNVLVYNGEIFGGIHVEYHQNDAEALMQALGNCCASNVSLDTNTCVGECKRESTIVDVLSNIQGPWAIIYFADSAKTLWFGRDAFGRRSLLVHWPTVEDSRFLLSSVSPASSMFHDSGHDNDNGTCEVSFWEELPCGIYSISFDARSTDGCLVGEVKRHEWTNESLKELIEWKRTCIVPKPGDISSSYHEDLLSQHESNSACLHNLQSVSEGIQAPVSTPAEILLDALRKSLIRRTSLYTIFQGTTSASRKAELGPVAILFSGGLDSMILAALLDECLDACYEIDLLNVSFDGCSAPDRISAKAGVQELTRIAPLRRWKLVEIDADLSNLTSETKHVMSLINPANTYMDLNIGIALWLASGGDGWIYESIDKDDKFHRRVKYKSQAKILLVGSGADEQCAGYGRHRTKYRQGGWHLLNEEMKLDIQRIWKRNLGRDDRCIADNGKEARFPFLDEDVIHTLLAFPLWEVTNLEKPAGTGDKKILREVAKLLGLHEAGALPKRAIQFGSRIARESNRKNFGSNRAANQASAGSVKFNKHSVLQ